MIVLSSPCAPPKNATLAERKATLIARTVMGSHYSIRRAARRIAERSSIAERPKAKADTRSKYSKIQNTRAAEFCIVANRLFC